MIIPCRRCGLKNEKDFKSFSDLRCEKCESILMKQEPDKILVECEDCTLGQQIHINQYDGFRCRSCGAKNRHPIKDPINGSGYSLNCDFLKTTINLDNDLVEAIDKKLESINDYNGKRKFKPPKVKRGQFIRMLLKQHFGFKF